MITVVMGAWALALIVVAVCWPHRLVHAAIVCSVFEGAAIVNAGGLGISPYYFATMLIAVRCAMVRVCIADFLGHSSDVRRIMAYVTALLALGLGSAIVMPWVFAGWPVLSARLSADAQAPLAFSASNIGQAVYLLLNVLMLWYTVQTCRTTSDARTMLFAFLIAGIITVGFAAYQLLSSLAGLPFPDDLLYSNQAYVMQHGTAILDMPRICSTFTEPAGLAMFLLSFIAFLGAAIETGFFGKSALVILLLAIAALMLSTSSTAYLGLAAITALGVGRYIFLPALKGRGSVKAAVAITVLIAAVVCACVVSDQLRDLVQTTVFEKDASSSYQERSEADNFSWQLAARTLGLGVGLGSNRASSFAPSLLSTLGIAGAALFVTLIVLLVRVPGGGEAIRRLHLPMAAALIGVVGAKLISSPDMATPGMWAAMAALLCVRAAAQEIPSQVSDEPIPQSPQLRRLFNGIAPTRIT